MNQQPNTNNSYLHARQESMPAAVRQLFEDPVKFNHYQRFKKDYSGQPTGTDMPEITRVKNDILVPYNDSVFAAMTDSGSHFVHIRRSNITNPRLAEEDRYFAVTVDAQTGKPTEWLVDAIRLSEPHEPDAVTYTLSEDKVDNPSTMQFSYKNHRAYMAFGDEPEQTFMSTFDIEHDLWILNHVTQQSSITADQLGRAA